MNPETLSAILTIILICAAGLTNVYKIYKKDVDPTLSTWAIILAATVMSFTTYLAAENRDIVAGSLNLADLFSTSSITLSILFLGSRKWKMRSYEKYYFLGLLIVGAFWYATSDPFLSNLLTQVIITIGYIPTIHTLYVSKTNTESFTVWGLILSASVLSLYPSVNAFLYSNNILALVYSVRSIVLLAIVLSIMFAYRKNNTQRIGLL